MSDPESTPSIREVQISEALRDTAWAYMPERARTASQGVTVAYWPRVPGNPEISLIYSPQTRNISISTKERIHPAAEAARNPNSSYYIRSATLQSETGTVLSYWEGAEIYDANGTLVAAPTYPLPPDPYLHPSIDQSAFEGPEGNYDDGGYMNARHAEAEHFEQEAFLHRADKETSQVFTEDKEQYLLGVFAGI